jgi:hypothetical protein
MQRPYQQGRKFCYMDLLAAQLLFASHLCCMFPLPSFVITKLMSCSDPYVVFDLEQDNWVSR